MKFRADLHCHTNFSDGVLSPEEIIAHAKEVGLSGLSITDHDNISAYPRAIKAAEEQKIWLGSGVEFSAFEGHYSVHILGYDFDVENAGLIAFCLKHKERRSNRNQKILEKLERLNMPLDLTSLEEKYGEAHSIGRPHIAFAMVEKGYVQSPKEAFDKYLGNTKPGFDPGVPISVDETIEIIHAAGGKAFIAHPHFMKNSRLISNLLKKPFDGIECHYARLNPAQEQKWLKIAKERDLLISGGSDFHGEIKPQNPLGCSWVDEETFEQIFQKNKWKF